MKTDSESMGRCAKKDAGSPNATAQGFRGITGIRAQTPYLIEGSKHLFFGFGDLAPLQV